MQISALTNALDQQRLHHAYLFTGTRGVGKTTLARILAKAINCETGITSTPCGKCSACVEIDAGRFIVPFGAFAAQTNPGLYRTVSTPLIFNMGQRVFNRDLGDPVLPMPYTDTGVNFNFDIPSNGYTDLTDAFNPTAGTVLSDFQKPFTLPVTSFANLPYYDAAAPDILEVLAGSGGAKQRSLAVLVRERSGGEHRAQPAGSFIAQNQRGDHVAAGPVR